MCQSMSSDGELCCGSTKYSFAKQQNNQPVVGGVDDGIQVSFFSTLHAASSPVFFGLTCNATTSSVQCCQYIFKNDNQTGIVRKPWRSVSGSWWRSYLKGGGGQYPKGGGGWYPKGGGIRMLVVGALLFFYF